jgi:hypothetical protein
VTDLLHALGQTLGGTSGQTTADSIKQLVKVVACHRIWQDRVPLAPRGDAGEGLNFE